MTESDWGARLEASYQLADAIMKDRATSFYQAFGNLPEVRFRGVAAVYAFCRFADDTIDAVGEPGAHSLGEARLILDELEAAVLAIHSDSAEVSAQEISARLKAADDAWPWWAAFEDTVRSFSIPLDRFVSQIDGQRMDADFTDIKDDSELVLYSRRVAGSVGTMLLPLLADDGRDMNDVGWLEACENLGVGMQITNILRDVGEDLRTRNRVYLPETRRTEYGVSRDIIERLSHHPDPKTTASLIPQSFIDMWESLATLADQYYNAYEPYLGWFHPNCRVALVAAALSYRAIADAVRKEKYNCFSSRCYTSAATRAALVLEAKRRVKRLV
ncbi:MAG TPA: phytoene/squalene synthase family protein [Clostridiaceae bacterium]|jgi:phytoene synthase|nr:phytoene/squalene synthase family protein [Clostridiaceae bacterium]